MEVRRRVSINGTLPTSTNHPIRFTAFSFHPRKIPFVAAWKEMDRYINKETQTEVETVDEETQTEVETVDKETQTQVEVSDNGSQTEAEETYNETQAKVQYSSMETQTEASYINDETETEVDNTNISLVPPLLPEISGPSFADGFQNIIRSGISQAPQESRWSRSSIMTLEIEPGAIEASSRGLGGSIPRSPPVQPYPPPYSSTMGTGSGRFSTRRRRHPFRSRLPVLSTRTSSLRDGSAERTREVRHSAWNALATSIPGPLRSSSAERMREVRHSGLNTRTPSILRSPRSDSAERTPEVKHSGLNTPTPSVARSLRGSSVERWSELELEAIDNRLESIRRINSESSAILSGLLSDSGSSESAIRAATSPGSIHSEAHQPLSPSAEGSEKTLRGALEQEIESWGTSVPYDWQRYLRYTSPLNLCPEQVEKELRSLEKACVRKQVMESRPFDVYDTMEFFEHNRLKCWVLLNVHCLNYEGTWPKNYLPKTPAEELRVSRDRGEDSESNVSFDHRDG